MLTVGTREEVFLDDLTGQPLPPDLVRKGRKLELDYFVKQSPCLSYYTEGAYGRLLGFDTLDLSTANVNRVVAALAVLRAERPRPPTRDSFGGTWELVWNDKLAKVPVINGYMPNRETLVWDLDGRALDLRVETLPFLPEVKIRGENLTEVAPAYLLPALGTCQEYSNLTSLLLVAPALSGADAVFFRTGAVDDRLRTFRMDGGAELCDACACGASVDCAGRGLVAVPGGAFDAASVDLSENPELVVLRLDGRFDGTTVNVGGTNAQYLDVGDTQRLATAPALAVALAGDAACK